MGMLVEWPSQNLPTFTHVFSIACNTHFHKNWQFMIMKAWRMQKTLVPAINLKTWKIYPMGWTVPPTDQTLMEKMWLWVEILVILLKVLIFCDSWSFKIKKPFFYENRACWWSDHLKISQLLHMLLVLMS